VRFLFTCCGTAGHVNPALAVASKIKESLPDSEFLFIGGGREIENRLVPKAGFEITNIHISGIERSLSPKAVLNNVKTVGRVISSERQMKSILCGFDPDVAVGTGGYVCYPVLKKAAGLGIPTAVHESNAVFGLTAKMLAPYVDVIMTAYDGMEGQLRDGDKVVHTGTPVRGEFSKLSREGAKSVLGISGKKLLVSFWGSLGAARMNQITTELIASEIRHGSFVHIHATGGGAEGAEKMKKELRDRGVPAEGAEDIDIRPYIDDMPVVMKAADIVLCRAGASTIAELTSLGKPAILVPSPNVTNDHQSRNAEKLASAGAALVLKEGSFDAETLFNEISSLINDDERLSRMSSAMKEMGVPGALDDIAGRIIGMAAEHSGKGGKHGG